MKALLAEASEESQRAYLDDGRARNPDDPEATHWVEVQFTKKHKIQVDSPGQQRSLIDGGFYDGSGRALDAALQHGADGYITFEIGDKVLLKIEGATDLLNLDVAKKLGSSNRELLAAIIHLI